MIGENNNWADWNRSILATVAGNFVGNIPAGELIPVLDHPLTDRIVSVSHNIDGIASRGVSLFQFNVASLWGTQKNVLTILSANVISDDYPGDNLRFETNVAEWLAIPKPTTAELLLMGLLCYTRSQFSRREILRVFARARYLGGGCSAVSQYPYRIVA